MPASAANPVPDLQTVLQEPPVRRTELATPVRRAELVGPDVRRAELVGPDVRRAELVDIPIGTTGPVTMPDGQQIVVTYRGTVPTFDQLPRQPGWNDMWKVTESGHAWVWTTPSGFSAPLGRTLDDAGRASLPKRQCNLCRKIINGTRGAFGKAKNRPPSPILGSQSPPPQPPIKFEELQDSIELPPSVKGDIAKVVREA